MRPGPDPTTESGQTSGLYRKKSGASTRKETDHAPNETSSTMDCDEFKRRLLTDPMDTDPEFRGHARDCPPCAAEAKRALAFEAELRRALAAETGTPLPHERGARRRWLLLGLLPLLAAAVWWALQLAPTAFGDAEGQQLGRLAVAHVTSEPDLLDTSGRGPVPLPQARLLLHNLGVDGPPHLAAGPTLRYAGPCRIGEQRGAHLVMDGDRGPVTALVLPATPRAGSARVRVDGFDALLLPRGDGAVALVGAPGEPLGALASRLGLRQRPQDAPPLRP
ncbi:hypothetical protein CKO31_03080 [Thiohalocapsa halophila]|uniref:Zinc-finger domain-containing protein n=2 Tax=Thiohalocapsa halophila TaxID=69359 RepID=A0ABS1CCV7_9GAMM|nr:hypothetical protein [Thiohalocapsa halophila]